MDRDSFPEQAGPLEGFCKEGDTYHSNVQGHPEQPCVSAAEQGSSSDSGGQLQTESMAGPSGNAWTESDLQPCYVWLEILPVIVPPVVPAEPPSRRAILSRLDFAMGAGQLVERMQSAAAATCGENSTDSGWQAVAPALAQSTRNMQAPPPSLPAAPTEQEKRYFCTWCREAFKMQMNLEVHYRYCRHKPEQETSLLFQALNAPIRQHPSASSSMGDSASPFFPQEPAPCPSSNYGKAAFNYASRSTADTSRRWTAMPWAMKKLWWCPQCGEKFVYKWQFANHLQGCGEESLPPNPQGLAADGLPGCAETLEEPCKTLDNPLQEPSKPSQEPLQEPCAEPDVRPNTSTNKRLYPCVQCGKLLSKCYLATHCAFHQGERYRCLWCWKVFNFRSGAMRHRKQHYKNDKDIKCPKCGRQVGDKDCFCMIQKFRISPNSNDRHQSGPEKPN